MKIFTLLAAALFSLGVIVSPIFAESSQQSSMVNANDQIQNLDKVLAQIKQEAKVPVLFPYQVPKPVESKKYFANRDSVAAQNGYIYWVNVDYTADCNGIKVCNVGNMTARRSTSPELFTDMQNNHITTEVQLSKNIKGYYTPGHPMGDYFPANVQWITNGVLYSLTWIAVPKTADEEKSALIAMANSAIIGGGSIASTGAQKTSNPLAY